MRSEMKKDERWTSDYFKRLGASSMLDFMRFNSLVAFDQMNGHSSRMSRREFALLISEADRDGVTEILKKMKKKEMEGGDDDKFESSHKNKKSKKKMEGGDDESSNKNQSKTDKKKMMMNADVGEQAGGYRFRLDPTNPEVQAKIVEMRKEFERRVLAAKALSDESRDPLLV